VENGAEGGGGKRIVNFRDGKERGVDEQRPHRKALPGHPSTYEGSLSRNGLSEEAADSGSIRLLILR